MGRTHHHTTVATHTTPGHDRAWYDTKLPAYFAKAQKMLHHNNDKHFLDRLKERVKCPETLYSETVQIIENGRFNTKQAMDLMTVALEPAQLTEFHKASGQRFFGHA